MKPSEVFDPVDITRRLKLYPVDVVDARLDVGDGPKRLYGQLFRIAVTIDRRKHPWPGFVFAGETFLAKRLGKSESSVRRDSAALRDADLVRVERPNRTENNRYYFLWHRDFDSADVSGQTEALKVDDSADVRCSDRSHPSAHLCFDSADLRGHDSADLRGPIKEKQRVEATPGATRQSGNAEVSKSTAAARNLFDEFRSEYPAKNGVYIESACRAYVGRVYGAAGEHERLMAGLRRWKVSADWQRRLQDAPDGHLIPSMERFITEGMYCDHPQAADEVPEGTPTAPPGKKWDHEIEKWVPAGALA